jgi:hypothetical protein
MKSQLLKLIALIALLTTGGFACKKDGNLEDDSMVSIKIENPRGEVDPYIFSFALPGIIDARCYKDPPYHPVNGGFPEV